MPHSPVRPCRKEGCKSFCERGHSYCRTHLLQAQKDYNKYQRDKEATAFYSSMEWRTTRELYRTEHPLCEQCEKEGRVVVGVLVDHIVPIKQGGARFDFSNLQTLCQTCHERKSHEEGSR